MLDRDNVLRWFTQGAPAQMQWGFAGLAVVGTAIWNALTGVLAALVVAFFVIDIILGTLKAIHLGGLAAFCGDRFMRGILKFIAAMVGITLAASVDLLLQYTGQVEDASYIASGMMGSICLAFAWSALKSLAHFVPEIGLWIDTLVRRVRPPDECPRRRASDQEEVP